MIVKLLRWHNLGKVFTYFVSKRQAGRTIVVEEFEIYNNKPIFYSLGNFVFDQNFSFETTHALTLELDLSRKDSLIEANGAHAISAQFTLLPITIDNSHPEPASSAVRADILRSLADVSAVSSDIQNEIMQGSISI